MLCSNIQLFAIKRVTLGLCLSLCYFFPHPGGISGILFVKLSPAGLICHSPPFISLLSPVGAVVQNFCMCLLLYGGVIFNNETERGRDRSAVPHRSSKFLSGPGNAGEAKKKITSSLNTSPQWAPDQTTLWVSGWASEAFVFGHV